LWEYARGGRRRFELSESDRARFQKMQAQFQELRGILDRQGERAEGRQQVTLGNQETMLGNQEAMLGNQKAMLELLQQVQVGLTDQGLRVDDIQRDLQAATSSGAEIVDLDAKEQFYMDQIIGLLAQTAITQNSTGEARRLTPGAFP